MFIEELSEAPAGDGAGDLLGPWRAQERAGGGRRRAISSPSTPPARSSPRCIARRRSIFKRGRKVVLVGHAGHPEVDRHDGPVAGRRDRRWSSTSPTCEALDVRGRDATSPMSPRRRCRSTTPREMVAALRRRFPEIAAPHKEDICYATTNRQEAIKRAAPQVDAVIVVGAANSSNSQRLREVARARGLPRRRGSVRASRRSTGRCSAASSRSPSPPAPRRRKSWSSRSSTAFAERFEIAVETLTTADETMFFPLPRSLRGEAALAR